MKGIPWAIKPPTDTIGEAAATVRSANLKQYAEQTGRFKRRQSMFCGLNPTRSTDRLREAFISLGKSGQNGANAGVKFLMCWLLAAIKTNLASAILYQLPTVKFSDHWSDCFGWLK